MCIFWKYNYILSDGRGGGGGLYTWTDCKAFLGWWIGWGACPRCLCLSAHSERKLHYERSALSTPIIASYCCSTEKVIEKKGKRTILSRKYHPIAYQQNTAHLKVSFLHAVTLPPRNRRTRVAARSAVDYCQLLWQQYGYIIIASSCDKNMVALLLPAPVATICLHYYCQFLRQTKWLHYYCQFLWQ